jgi:alkylation response protein AidB-like acyl-CoA dehydrogenase
MSMARIELPGELSQETERLASLARAQSAENEQARALSAELVAGLRAAGLMRAGAPAQLGALQAPPAVTLACAERLARGDASAGWCVSIACTSSLLAGWMPEAGAAEVLGGGDDVAAGVWAPRGRATPVDGGLRVSGRWAFCSGISHSNWLFAGCVLEDGGDDAAPVLRVVAMPTAELEILDTWHTGGLRATASNDAVAKELFVPAERVLSLLGSEPRLDERLYRFPAFGYFALSIAAAALGNARGAIDDLMELALEKVGLGQTRTLAERPATQSAVAQAEAALEAARALYYEAIEAAWQAAAAGAVETPQRLGLRLAATHAVQTSASVARAMYDLGGGSAIYERSPLQRRFRDAHTATAHFQVSLPTWELMGRVLLGLPARTEQL